MLPLKWDVSQYFNVIIDFNYCYDNDDDDHYCKSTMKMGSKAWCAVATQATSSGAIFECNDWCQWLWRQYDADYDEHYCNYCKSLICSCNPGHILWGNASRNCKADGTWQGELAMNRIRDNFHCLFWFSPFFATLFFFSLPLQSCNLVG